MILSLSHAVQPDAENSTLNHGNTLLLNWERKRSWPTWLILRTEEEASSRRLSNSELLSLDILPIATEPFFFFFFFHSNPHVGSFPHIRRHLQESTAVEMESLGNQRPNFRTLNRTPLGNEGYYNGHRGHKCLPKKAILLINGNSFTAHQVNKSAF